MPQSSVFPIYIKAEYDGSGRGFDGFTTAAKQAASEAQRAFDALKMGGGQISGDEYRKWAQQVKILESIYRDTDQAIGRVTKSARESAAVFANVDASAAGLAAEMQNLLRATNPAAAAQQDFERATERVSQALRRGIITTAQAEAANAQLRSELARGAGTMGAVRQASVQAGQQLQDIAISLYSGQRAGVVFAQQLPQLAFALSSLEGSANKTQDRIGRLATFLSGPWGLAVGLAVGVLGTYIASLFSAGEEADKAKSKTYDFSRSIDVLSLSAAEGANAMQQLEQATRGAIRAQGDFLNIQAATASASVASLENRISQASRELASINQENQRFGFFGTGLGPVAALNSRRKSALEEQIASDRAALSSARAAKANTDIALSQRRVNESLDAGAKSAGEYERAIGDLNARRRESLEGTGDPLSGRYITQQEYESEYRRLTLVKKAAEDAARAEKKTGHGQTGRSDAERAAVKANRETERLSRISDQAAASVAQITMNYDNQPRAIDRITKALSDLKALRDSLFEPKNVGSDGKSLVPNAEKILSDIDKAKALVTDAPMQRLRDMERTAQEQAAIDGLRLRNRNSEAEVLTRVLDLQRGGLTITEDVADRVMQIVAGEQLRSVEMEKQNRAQQRNLELLARTQSNVRQGIRELLDGKGLSAIGNVISRQFEAYKDGLADQIAESLFPDLFNEQKLKILGLDKVDEAGQAMAVKIVQLVTALEALRKAADSTAAAMGGTPGAANDNSPAAAAAKTNTDIVVTATRSVPQDLRGSMRAILKGIVGAKLGDKIEGLMYGGALGQAGAGTFLGSGGVNAGSFIGGAFGEAIFKKAAPKLFKKLGDFAGPIGSIAGGLIGGVIGKIFGGTPKGSSTITSIGGTATYSGSKGLKDQVSGLGGSVQSGLQNILDRLGGEEGAFRVSIGKRGKDFVVDPTGRGRTKGSGVLKFKSEEEAVRAALLDAINDGAVAGLRQGAQNLLRAGKDIERQVQKAYDFEQVFTRLKRYKDPVGAALDDLDREFKRLQTIFAEANATSEEYAQLEELYGLERAKAIKAATDQITASLRSLYDELTINNSALSLRDRKTEALAKYNPLADRVRAGDTSAYDDFAEAARALLGIERELSGSGNGYFSLLEEVTRLTKSTLDATTATAEASANRASPFAPPTANDNEAVIGAMNQLGFFIVNGLMIPLTAINENLRSLVLHGYVSGNGNGGPVLNANVNYF